MASISDGYRFFVGIGAQRCGTTWLGHYLREHPEIGFSPLKEIRFFESKYFEKMAGIVRSRHQTKLAVTGILNHGRKAPLDLPELAWHFLGIRRHNDHHYRRFMDVVARGHKIGGEISPSYALLDTPAIAEMDRILSEPRYLLSLRNPADRLMSEISYRRNTLGLDSDLDASDTEAMIARRLEVASYLDYVGPVTRYDSVVAAERLKIFFYEDLFDRERQQGLLDEITAHLGVSSRSGSTEKRVNASKKLKKDDVDRGEIVRALEDQYRFAETRFGDALPAAWRRDLELL